MEVVYASPWVAVLAVGVSLLFGVYLVAVIDTLLGALVAGERPAVGAALALPTKRAALLLVQERVRTERPDAVAWALAPAMYGGLAAVMLTVVPLDAGVAVADVGSGIVLWGAGEALTFVAVFLHGWSPNSVFPLIGGYRYVAQAVSFELLTMFVLIAAALPAESLQVSAIVLSQEGLWNVVRQPLGLPLWIVVALAITFWGPLNLPDGDDLAGGTTLESSGSHRLVWELARAAMLVAFAAMGAAAFLGGWLGPWLPGPVWMVLKTVGLLAVLVGLRHVLARLRPERFVRFSWTVLLPLAFLDLLIAGLGALP